MTDKDSFTKRELKEIEKLQRIYLATFEEAAELYEFDKKHTDSDKATQAYLSEEFGIEGEDLDELFYKAPAATRKNRVKIRKATEVAQERREDRLGYLAEELGKLGIFGTVQTVTNTAVTFLAPDTGFGITVKLTRHKAQKIINKHWNPEPDYQGNFSMQDQRVTALHEIVAGYPEMFKGACFSSSAIGLTEDDPRYPFASIKMTHHKS